MSTDISEDSDLLASSEMLSEVSQGLTALLLGLIEEDTTLSLENNGQSSITALDLEVYDELLASVDTMISNNQVDDNLLENSKGMLKGVNAGASRAAANLLPDSEPIHIEEDNFAVHVKKISKQ